MEMFRNDNTDGYTQAQLDSLNSEWEALATELGLDPDDDEYKQAASNFGDEVSRRSLSCTGLFS